MKQIDAEKLHIDITITDGVCKKDYVDWEQIKAAPTIQPKKSCWSEIADGSPWDGEYQCLRCGWINERRTKFCPDCGADMRIWRGGSK